MKKSSLKPELSADIFKHIYPLSQSSFKQMENIFEVSKIEKNELFVHAGQKNQSEYVILQGYCRSFLLSPDGEEITLAFYKQHDVISPHIIRTKHNVSLLNFQALTELELIQFDSEKFLSLMISNLEIRDFGNTILKNELFRKTEKEIALASHTAKERLIRFREEFAMLENLIPHPIIASYLGITNVSLSRLRADTKNS